jgi:hypothetical protein
MNIRWKKKEKEKLLNEQLSSKASAWYRIPLDLDPADRKYKNDWMCRAQKKVT